MDASPPKAFGPNDVTLDGQRLSTPGEATAKRAAAGSRSPSAIRGDACMNLVEGTGPGMTCMTRAMLRHRLRIAALVLFAGYVAFLLFRLLLLGFPNELYVIELGVHLGMMVVLGFLAVGLCRGCEISLTKLRVMEVAVFGLPALHAAFYSAAMMRLSAQRVVDLAEKSADASRLPLDYFYNAVDNTPGIWLLLIFTYALFIPNTWRRAALVVGAIALTPIGLVAGLSWLDPIYSEAARIDPTALVQMPLLMILASVAAVAGVHTIGSLRREAFRARQLGQYHLRHRLGAGGMGEVYLAEHQLMKRPCAIKVIRPEKAGDPQVLARFEREVQSTARLSHWNSVEIFDYGRSEDGSFYYVMEYLPGMNLQELVDRHGPLPAERAIHFLRQTCDALGEAHSMSLLHRDIKPANIFAAKRGGLYDVAKLLDFGLAKPLAQDADEAHLTQDGAITGSPLYMAPEQAIGEHEVDERADIYSLGAVAYFLLTGSPPFNYVQPLRVMMAHANDPPAPLQSLRPEISEDLSQVVMRCLEKRPEDRYASAGDLAEALAACQASDLWTRQMAANWWQTRQAERIEALA